MCDTEYANSVKSSDTDTTTGNARSRNDKSVDEVNETKPSNELVDQSEENTTASRFNEKNSSEGDSPNDINDVFKAPVIFKKPDITNKNVAVNAASSDKTQTKHLNIKQNISKVTEPIKEKTLHNQKSPKQETKIPYVEPLWTGLCDGKYSFDVLKTGKIIDSIDITSKTHYVFGRLRNCDIPMDHPSLSRYHAVVQYCSVEKGNRGVGWYLYDLGSTHGTWVNKRKIDPKIYVRLRVGYMIKFGGSSRLFILQGPSSDEDQGSELTITEMKQKVAREKLEAELLKQENQKEASKIEDDSQKGCSWGMNSLESEDAEIDPDAPNPFALESSENEKLYLDDPKKTLRGYFEREGLDMPEYIATEVGYGKHKCTVELPVDDANGMPLVAEATVTGKKKESVIACALEACRLLDRHGELRKATHESREKKAKNWAANDFYDSDDDEFLDRTGDIEKKRQQRMKRVGKTEEGGALTYDAIKSQLDEIDKEIKEIEAKLEEAKSQSKSVDSETGGLDALDAFMENIKGGAMDTKTKLALKRRIFDLKREQAKLEKLADVARPANVPAIKPKTTSALPMFGKRKIPSKSKLVVKPPKPIIAVSKSKHDAEEEEEEEEDENEEDNKKEVAKEKEQTYSRDTETNQGQEMETDSKDIQKEASNSSALKDNDDGGSNSKQKEEQIEETVSRDSSCDTEIEETLKQSITKTESSESGVPDVTTDPNQGSEKPTDLKSPNNKAIQGKMETDQEMHLSETQQKSDSIDNSKVKGPTLPPSATLQKKPEDDQNASKAPEQKSETLEFEPEKAPPPAKKRRRERKRPDKKKVQKSNPATLSSSDPDYAAWLPPENQSGDGTTHLNAKFGY